MDDNISIKVSVDLSTLSSGLQAAQQQVNQAVNSMRTSFAGLNQSTQQAVTGANNVGNATNNMGNHSSATTAILNQLNVSINRLNTSLVNSHTHLNQTANNISHVGNTANTSTNNVNNFGSGVNSSVSPTSNLTGAVGSLGRAFAGLVSIQVATQYLKESRDAFIQAEKSFRGLESVANFSGVGITKAMESVKRVSSDGLISVSAASEAMKNYLLLGMSVNQAEKMINISKNTGAFGGNKALSLDQKVTSVSEGYRQGNSTLTDNGGITKNLSVMLKEYADTHSLVAENLTKSQIAQAYFDATLREGESAAGNAAKLLDTMSGAMANAEARATEAKETIGQAFAPAIQFLSEIIVNFQESLANAVKGIQILTATFAYAQQVQEAFTNGVKSFSLQKMRDEVKTATDVYKDYVTTISNAKGANLKGNDNPQNNNKEKEDTAEQKFKKAEELYKQEIQLAKNKDELTKIQLSNDLKMLEANNELKLKNHKEYAKRYESIQNDMANSTATFLNTQLEGLKKLLSIGYEPKNANIKVDISKTEGDINENEEKRKGIKYSPKITGGGSSGPTKADIGKAEYNLKKSDLENELALFKAHNQGLIAINDYKLQNFKMSEKDYYDELSKLKSAEHEKEKQIINEEVKELKARKPKDAVDSIKIKEDINKANARLKISEEEYANSNRQSENSLNSYNQALAKNKAMKGMSNSKEQADANLDIGQLGNEKKFVLHKLTNLQMIEEDKLLEQAKYQNTVNYLNAQKDYLLKNETENAQAIMDINSQLESAKIQSEVRTAQFKHQMWLEQSADYIAFTDTMRGSLSKMFLDIAKHPKNFKEAMTNALQSIADKLLDIASKKLMEQAFGGGSGGAGGGGSSLISQGINYVAGAMGFSLPSFDVGTNSVPKDMVAQIHAGERIVPAKFNNAENNYGGGQSKGSNISVNNNFIMSQTPDKRTQQQMAAMVGSSISNASRRNN